MRVGVTADLRGEDGRPAYDLSLLDQAEGVEWEWIRGEGELTADEVAPFDAIVLFHPHVTAATCLGARSAPADRAPRASAWTTSMSRPARRRGCW